MGEFSFSGTVHHWHKAFFLCFRSHSQSLCSSTLRPSAGGWDRQVMRCFWLGCNCELVLSNLQQDSFHDACIELLIHIFHRCIYTYFYRYFNQCMYTRSAVYFLLISYDDMIMLIQCATFTSHNFPYAAFLWHCGRSMADHDLRKYPATDIFDAWLLSSCQKFRWRFGKIWRRDLKLRHYLGDGFNFFYIFTPNLGKIPILTHIFQMGWFNHQQVILPRWKTLRAFVRPARRGRTSQPLVMWKRMVPWPSLGSWCRWWDDEVDQNHGQVLPSEVFFWHLIWVLTTDVFFFRVLGVWVCDGWVSWIFWRRSIVIHLC